MADEPRQEHELLMGEDGSLRENYTFRDTDDIRRITRMNIGWTNTADATALREDGSVDESKTYQMPVMLVGSVPQISQDDDPVYQVFILSPDDVIHMCIQGLKFFNGTESVIETLESIRGEYHAEEGPADE